jgi:hypothetical protein
MKYSKKEKKRDRRYYIHATYIVKE